MRGSGLNSEVTCFWLGGAAVGDVGLLEWKNDNGVSDLVKATYYLSFLVCAWEYLHIQVHSSAVGSKLNWK